MEIWDLEPPLNPQNIFGGERVKAATCSVSQVGFKPSAKIKFYANHFQN